MIPLFSSFSLPSSPPADEPSLLSLSRLSRGQGVGLELGQGLLRISRLGVLVRFGLAVGVKTWEASLERDSESLIMLVPFVLGLSGILPVVALVAWLVQSPAEELPFSVPSLLRSVRLPSQPWDLGSSGVGGSTTTASVTSEGVTEKLLTCVPFDSTWVSWLGWSSNPGALAVAKLSWSWLGLIVRLE